MLLVQGFVDLALLCSFSRMKEALGIPKSNKEVKIDEGKVAEVRGTRRCFMHAQLHSSTHAERKGVRKHCLQRLCMAQGHLIAVYCAGVCANVLLPAGSVEHGRVWRTWPCNAGVKGKF